MKIIKTMCLLVVMPLCMAMSCDDEKEAIPITTSINGDWKFNKVTQGPDNTTGYDFAPGEIVWTFNTNNNTVTIVNNNTDESKPDFFESGTYDLEIIDSTNDPSRCSYILKISQLDLGCVDIAGKYLYIDRGLDITPMLHFSR